MYRIFFSSVIFFGLTTMGYSQCINGVCSLRSTPSVFSQSVTVNTNEYNLAPGEILVAVNGVPVSQAHQGPVVQAVETVGSVVVGAVRAVGSTVSGISSRIVNRDPVAYEHALREAQILANRRGSGHPLGVAPGCSYSGTGTSFNPESPNHCYNTMPESRLIARAVVVGSDGKYYWSAHYR